MVSLVSLAIPIVVSAVIVFIASTVLHMLVPLHRNDYRKVPSEDQFQAAIRSFDLPSGDYVVPCAGSPAGMKDPAFLERMKKGPVAIMTLMAGGAPSMAISLVQWFVYSLIISLFAGYIASRALGPGARYLAVFRFVGCSAFMGYSLGLFQDSIWYHRNWGATSRYALDGLIYGLLTAGTFGWLWPQ